MNDNLATIRHALAGLDPASSHEPTQAPEVGRIYTPSGHEAALDPDRSLVVGGRGSGKTFWSSALAGPESRAYAARVYPRTRLENCQVKLGFAGVDITRDGAPSPEILDELIDRDGHDPTMVWRAVVLFHAAAAIGEPLPASWRDVLPWVAEDAQRVQATLRRVDETLARQDRRLLVVFDALDRVGRNWDEIRKRTKALLRIVLAFRSYRAIHLKVFLRTDQIADPAVTDFPDASKIVGARVALSWERRDLYGLAYLLLANDPTCSDEFSRLVERSIQRHLAEETPRDLPIALKDDEAEQETLFAAIAGRHMGRDPRRGRTYTWLHNHLADAHGQVSPRSFLVALNAAASNRPAPADTAIDPKGIHAGVKRASELRVEQLREEHGWIGQALEPLADLRVPCQQTDMLARWRQAGTVQDIRAGAGTGGFLEPLEFVTSSPDESALIDALRRLGVLERRPDGRINMPDIFRVAAQMLRRGGVSPRTA